MRKYMKKLSTQKIVISGAMLAIGLILPFLTAQIPGMGSKILPMHIPVLLTGFLCGWPYGLLVGFIVPIFRSLLFTMPPMFPTAVAMAFELATYGTATGIMYYIFPKKNIFIYINLIISMICGRIIWGIVSLFLFGLNGTSFTWKIFVSGALLNALPGIIIQIIIIPIIIISLKKGRIIDNE
jgi:thiamine transporter ThiT